MHKKIRPLHLLILAVLATVGLYVSTIQPEGNRTFKSASLAENNVCLLFQSYGELFHSSFGNIGLGYSVYDYDVSADGSFIVFAGSRSLGRDRGSETDAEGNVYGWDVEVFEEGAFTYTFSTGTVTPIWLTSDYTIQGVNSVTLSPTGEYVVFTANQYGEGTGGDEEMFLITIAGGEFHQLTENMVMETNPEWYTSNHLVYITTSATSNYYASGAGTVDLTTFTLNDVETSDGGVDFLGTMGNSPQPFYSYRLPGERITNGNFSRPANYLQIWQDTLTGEPEPVIGIADHDLTNPMQLPCPN